MVVVRYFLRVVTKQLLVFVLRDGASRCGLIRVIADVISRMTSEGQMDVYTGVKHVQNVRPESVSSVVGSVHV